ncbi:MAG: response regulator [Terracidiphilus sp.]|jgi:CheY-like chemotaxis protein
MSEPNPALVYVVDNEPTIASTLAAILNLSGFRATAFTAPLEAIAAAKSDCPSLLITDVAMPEMNGVELAIRFEATCPACKVLMFSGHVTTQDLLMAAREQGREFQVLAKPIHPADLLAAIRKL